MPYPYKATRKQNIISLSLASLWVIGVIYQVMKAI